MLIRTVPISISILVLALTPSALAQEPDEAIEERSVDAPAEAPPDPTPSPRLRLEPTEEAPSSKIVLTPQETMIERPRSFHNHDGFYLRANFGYGLLWGGFDVDAPGAPELDASGSGIGLDLLIGGTPSPGFVLGGGILSSWSFSVDFESEGASTTRHDLGSSLIGVFVDGFPQSTGGWHLGGLVGLATQTLSNDGVVDDTLGFGGAAWAGYDQWVGPDWSVGGLLRFSAARTFGEKDYDVSASTATLNLMFTALYH